MLNKFNKKAKNFLLVTNFCTAITITLWWSTIFVDGLVKFQHLAWAIMAIATLSLFTSIGYCWAIAQCIENLDNTSAEDNKNEI